MSRRVRSAGAAGLLACGVFLVLALLGLGGVAPESAAARTVHFDGKRVEAPKGLAGLPAQPAPADVRAARPARGLPGDAGGATSAAPPTRSGGGGRSWSNRARRRAASALPVPARPGATRLGRRQRLHRARLRRLRGALLAARWRPGRTRPTAAIGVYIGGTNRGLLAAEPDRELGQRPDRRRLAHDPHLRRPAGADQQLQQLRQAQPQPRHHPGRRSGGRRGRPGRRDRRWAPAARSTSTWSPTAAPPAPPAPTLAFLEAWTEKLHSLGYVSGVYSSSASGIADLAAELGSGYVQPDNLWFANWNGQASSADSYIPSNAWSRPPADPPVPRRPRRDLRRRHDQHRQQLRRRRHGRRRRADPPATKTRSARSTWSAPPSPARCGSRAGPSTPTRRPKRWRSAPTSAAAPAPPAASPTTSARSPTRHGSTSAPSSAAPARPRLRRHLPDRQVGAAAGLRLRPQHRRRHRPPARLQVDHGPGRGHRLAASRPADGGQGLARLRMAGRDRMPRPAGAAHPVQSRRQSRTAAARRRGPARSPARSAGAPFHLTGSAVTAS